MGQSIVVTLETKTCPCGCRLTYRGLPEKPAQYFSRAHRPIAPEGQYVTPFARGRGRPKKHKAAYTPENGEGGTGELVLEDAGGEAVDLRELALGYRR